MFIYYEVIIYKLLFIFSNFSNFLILIKMLHPYKIFNLNLYYHKISLHYGIYILPIFKIMDLMPFLHISF